MVTVIRFRLRQEAPPAIDAAAEAVFLGEFEQAEPQQFPCGEGFIIAVIPGTLQSFLRLNPQLRLKTD